LKNLGRLQASGAGLKPFESDIGMFQNYQTADVLWVVVGAVIRGLFGEEGVREDR
jgi:hypothetical protein